MIKSITPWFYELKFFFTTVSFISSIIGSGDTYLFEKNCLIQKWRILVPALYSWLSKKAKPKSDINQNYGLTSSIKVFIDSFVSQGGFRTEIFWFLHNQQKRHDRPKKRESVIVILSTFQLENFENFFCDKTLSLKNEKIKS